MYTLNIHRWLPDGKLKRNIRDTIESKFSHRHVSVCKCNERGKTKNELQVIHSLLGTRSPSAGNNQYQSITKWYWLFPAELVPTSTNQAPAE